LIGSKYFVSAPILPAALLKMALHFTVPGTATFWQVSFGRIKFFKAYWNVETYFYGIGLCPNFIATSLTATND
jgi:hypothetical protein